MKNPKEYLNHFGIVGMEVLLSEMIKKVQRDSYNKAIEDAKENISLDYGEEEGEVYIDYDSLEILKIK